MLPFRKAHDGRLMCQFEHAELSLLTGLISQLVELLLDSQVPAGGPGTQWFTDEPADCDAVEDEDQLFVRLEREMGSEQGSDDYGEYDDPVMKRLFPNPYPDDPAANYDFQRFSRTAQLDDKVSEARTVLGDIEAIDDSGWCYIVCGHAMSWLKTLNNVRLALAVRLGIDHDYDRFDEIPDDDPRSWTFSIYEWLGWVQESLLITNE